MNFSSILIGSANPEALVAYYTPILGTPMFTGGGYTSWQIGQGGMTVGPHDQVHGKNDQPGRLIWNMESPDVKGDAAKFVAAGAIVITAPYEFEQAPGTWIATFADPDNNYFQLMSPFDAAAMQSS